MTIFSRVSAEEEAVFWASVRAPRGDIARRVEDVILGGAIGDAMGFPFSMMPREDILPLLEAGRLRYRPHPSGRFDPGQWTDDTQMTMTTSRVFVRCGAPDIEAFSAEMADFHDAEAGRGLISPGAACLQAIGRLAGGYSHEISGCSAGRAGCGALARIAPVALLPWKDELSLLAAVYAFGGVTHTDSRSFAACAVFSLVLHRSVYGCAKGGQTLATTDGALAMVSEAAVAVSQASQPAATTARGALAGGCAVAGFLDDLRKFTAAPADEAADWLTRGSFNFEGSRWVTPYVVPVLGAALLSWASFPNSPADSLRTAISFGGVTDSVASLTGQLHGTGLGGPGWDKSLVEALKDCDSIRETASSLGRMAISGPVWSWREEN